eukprot:CAMPEP_0168617564 /NCGR_PEP_ID=MMETSP0449_2-20121227/5605_1 /TAXON_ID=1082188 /ORGANISM="Strombidium rassoulzadegani, Strain ras09" /LENGTH=111 /DNA_ID=CAMNT_0008658379 /DNA_START=1 /DNA_END=336 /DNA_ORIENTATION=-
MKINKQVTNALIGAVMMAAFVEAQTAATVATVGAGTVGLKDDEPVKINKWMSPSVISGLLTFLFLLIISLFSFGLLAAIQVPSYQIPANDGKNKDNYKDWSKIWGNIEKAS